MDRQFELIVWQHLKVSRSVVPGVGIENSALPLKDSGDLSSCALVIGRSALEEHVLEEVRIPGMAYGLISRSDMVDDHEGDHRSRPLRNEQNLQPIRVKPVF